MKRELVLASLLLLGAGALTACAPEASGPAASDAPAAAAPGNGDDSEPAAEESSDASPSTSDSVMPAGARPASADLPFPVPEDWPEVTAFTEEKIGKDKVLAATYEYPGDPSAAAERYGQLLKQAGFDVRPNQLGVMVHDASILADGAVNGVKYQGIVDFDTDADGIQRAMITLREE